MRVLFTLNSPQNEVKGTEKHQKISEWNEPCVQFNCNKTQTIKRVRGFI